jgi:hypothetical protein
MIMTLVLTWVIGPVYQLSNFIATAAITPAGDCNVFSVYVNAAAQQAVGLFTILIQFLVPLTLMGLFYGHMALILHKRVEPATQTSTAGNFAAVCMID